VIVGLTGFCCSGKDTVAEYLSKKYGYKHFSLSNIIREIMIVRGIESTRENLILFGTKLREENGNAILAEKVLKKIEPNSKCCVTSIRHSDEVNVFRRMKDFILINIDASQSVRFRRMQKRKRVGDPETLREFKEFERKEFQMEGSGQQLRKTATMADVTLVNASNDITILEIAIEDLLKNMRDVV